MYDLTVIQNYSLGGKTYTLSQTLSQPDLRAKEDLIPIAYSGVLTTRTSNNAGVITMDAAHILTTADFIDIYWLDANGNTKNCRYADITAVSALTAGSTVTFAGAKIASSRAITGCTNATPAVITSVAHGLISGDRVTIASVGGSTGANVTGAYVTVTGADTFGIYSDVARSAGIAAGGAYTSGGTWVNYIAGTDLPIATTAIQVCIVKSFALSIIGNNVNALLAACDTAAAVIVLLDGSGLTEEVVMNIAPNGCFGYLGVGTNPLSGLTIDTCRFSMNDVTTPRNCRVAAQLTV